MKEDWDWGKAVRREGRKARVVVSVAMSREDFEAITREAEAHAMPVSVYIREVVRGRVAPSVLVTAGISSGGPLTIILRDGQQVA